MSASVDAAEGLVSAHDATTTFNCKTPGCNGEAKTAAGRHCYCRECQIKRGIASADGTMIHKPSPPSSGSAISRGRRHDNPGAGSYERKVLELAAAARELDLALRSYRDAKPRLERAIQGWRSALVMFRRAWRRRPRRRRLRRRRRGGTVGAARPSGDLLHLDEALIVRPILVRPGGVQKEQRRPAGGSSDDIQAELARIVLRAKERRNGGRAGHSISRLVDDGGVDVCGVGLTGVPELEDVLILGRACSTGAASVLRDEACPLPAFASRAFFGDLLSHELELLLAIGLLLLERSNVDLPLPVRDAERAARESDGDERDDESR